MIGGRCGIVIFHSYVIRAVTRVHAMSASTDFEMGVSPRLAAISLTNILQAWGFGNVSHILRTAGFCWLRTIALSLKNWARQLCPNSIATKLSDFFRLSSVHWSGSSGVGVGVGVGVFVSVGVGVGDAVGVGEGDVSIAGVGDRSGVGSEAVIGGNEGAGSGGARGLGFSFWATSSTGSPK